MNWLYAAAVIYAICYPLYWIGEPNNRRRAQRMFRAALAKAGAA